MVLKFPAPCVVVLVGPSRTGKTTWAHAHFGDNEVVSSDALRAMVGIGEDDQVASNAAFSLLDQIVASRLSRKLTTIIDTTRLHSETRKKWVPQAAETELPIYALLFRSTLEEADNLSQRRTRPIPKSVLRKQFSNFDKAETEVPDEGFDGVYDQQPVRVVTPALVSTEPTGVVESSASHTFGLLLSRFD